MNKNKDENWEHYPIKFTNPYWSRKTRIEMLQRRIIIYSIIYYEYNNNVVSDFYYEQVNKQLLWYIKHTSSEELKKTRYWYCMHDYDGSTGYHLRERLDEQDRAYLLLLSSTILSEYMKEKQKEQGDW